MRRTKDHFVPLKNFEDNKNVSGLLDFDGEDLCTTLIKQLKIQEKLYLNNNKNKTFNNKCKKNNSYNNN